MQDLVLLVADKNMQFTLKGALLRPKALGISPASFDFLVHAGRDGGVRKTGPEILSLERKRFRHALLLLDHEGSGAPGRADELEAELNERLRTRWDEQARAIVITPEVDVWLWGSDNSLAEVFAWNKPERIRAWIESKGFQLKENGKPERPKEAIEALLQELQQPRSSALYQRVAEKISLTRCRDDSFLKLKRQLQDWFPERAEQRRG